MRIAFLLLWATQAASAQAQSIQLAEMAADRCMFEQGLVFLSKSPAAVRLEQLPKPGECKEADGLYSSDGVWKIPDNCTCTIVCDSSGQRTGGGGLLCLCMPIPWKPDSSQTPQHSPNPLPEWPPSPFPSK